MKLPEHVNDTTHKNNRSTETTKLKNALASEGFLTLVSGSVQPSTPTVLC